MGYSWCWTRARSLRKTGVSVSAMMGTAITAMAAQSMRACHSHCHSWRMSAMGCSRAAWKSWVAEKGMGAVWKIRLAMWMNGMTRMSSSG